MEVPRQITGCWPRIVLTCIAGCRAQRRRSPTSTARAPRAAGPAAPPPPGPSAWTLRAGVRKAARQAPATIAQLRACVRAAALGVCRHIWPARHTHALPGPRGSSPAGRAGESGCLPLRKPASMAPRRTVDYCRRRPLSDLVALIEHDEAIAAQPRDQLLQPRAANEGLARGGALHQQALCVRAQGSRRPGARPICTSEQAKQRRLSLCPLSSPAASRSMRLPTKCGASGTTRPAPRPPPRTRRGFRSAVPCR
jgi:hypothetical protein